MLTALDFGIWALAVAFFVLAFFIDIERIGYLRRNEVQMIIGVLIVALILFVDAIVGLLLGLGFLILFYRSHDAMMPKGESWAGAFRDNDYMVTLEDYITPAHLERAQENTIDSNTNAKMIGIKDPYGGAVYDAQSTFHGMPGNDLTESHFAPVIA